MHRQVTTASDETTPVFPNSGLAGTATGVEGEAAAAIEPELARRTTEEDNREMVVGTQQTMQEDEVGVVRGMTVSILLDHKEVEMPAGEGVDAEAEEGEDSAAVTQRVAYTVEEQEAFKQMVLAAIGYDAALGHQRSIDPDMADGRFSVSIQSLPMYHDPDTQAIEEAGLLGSLSQGGEVAAWLRWAVAAIVALTLLIVAKGQLKRSHAAWEAELERRRDEERRAREAAAERSGKLLKKKANVGLNCEIVSVNRCRVTPLQLPRS